MYDAGKNVVFVAVALLFAAIVFWFSFGPGRVPDNRNGADQIRADIQSAGEQQSAAIDRLATIEAGLDDSAAKAGELSAGIGNTAEAIAGIESRIGEGAERTRTSQQLAREGRRILQTIRERGTISQNAAEH